VSLLAETNSGTAPTEEELMGWASDYNLTSPVLSDSSWGVSNRYEEDGGIPTQTLIGPGMEIIHVDEWISDSQIEEVLP
jgi:hypothetical protein